MTPPPFSALEDQLRECFGRVVYTHKTHEKMAEKCSETLRRLKIWQIVISAVATSSAISIIFSDKYELKLATAALSIVSLVLSGYMKGFDPGGTAQKHRDAGSALWAVRESYLSLLTDLRGGTIDNKDALLKRDDLQKKLGAVLKGAPQTNANAYSAAQKALKENEEYTFSDKEIDCFVPSSLRKELLDEKPDGGS